MTLLAIRHALAIGTALIACLLSSCIDGHEEIWLNADGSGRAEVIYTVPAEAARFQGGEAGLGRLIGNFLKQATPLSNSSYQISTEGDRLKIQVNAAFKSALQLKKLSKGTADSKLPAAARYLAGEVDTHLSGRTLHFARTISPGKALPGSSFIPSSQTQSRKLTYIIHLPMAIEDSNATRTEDQGRTLIWDYPLVQALKQPFTTQFTAKVPIPTWAIFAVSLIILAITAGIIWMLRKRSQRSTRLRAND
jgi:hypothetical protein